MTTEEQRKENLKHDRVEGAIKNWLEKKEREKQKTEDKKRKDEKPAQDSRQ